jgi:hypothetical protein
MPRDAEIQQSPVGADYEIHQPCLAGVPPIDARTLQEISGIPLSTINVWIGRDLFPGVEPGTPGRARYFAADFAMHLVITGCLVRLGCAIAIASNFATHIMLSADLGRPGLKCLIGPTGGPTGSFTSPVPRSIQVTSTRSISSAQLAGGAVVLDLSWLARRLMKAAEEQR